MASTNYLIKTFMPVSKASTSSVQAVWVELTLQLNWLDNKREHRQSTGFLLSSDIRRLCPRTSQFIRNYMEKDPIAYRPSHPLTHRRRLKNTRFISIQIASYPAMVSLKTLKYGRGISRLLVLQAYVKLGGGWIQSKGRNIIKMRPHTQHLQYARGNQILIDPNIDPHVSRS